MLSIAGSYNCVQFQGKLTTQTWENGNYFGPYGRNLGTKLFSWILTLLHVTHCRKLSLYAISRNTNQPNLTKWQNSSFRINFGPFRPNLGPKNFFHRFYLYFMLDIVASYHCLQFQRKVMNQTWENYKKPSFGTNFGPFGPNLGSKNFFSKILPLLRVRHCCKLSLYATSRKLMNQIWENGRKPGVRSNFGPFFPKFGPKTFFCVLTLDDMHCCKL